MKTEAEIRDVVRLISAEVLGAGGPTAHPAFAASAMVADALAWVVGDPGYFKPGRFCNVIDALRKAESHANN